MAMKEPNDFEVSLILFGMVAFGLSLLSYVLGHSDLAWYLLAVSALLYFAGRY